MKRLRAALATGSLLTVTVASACISPAGSTSETGLDQAIEALLPLIEAECAWRFSCCDFGETAWTFGFSVTDADRCEEQILASLVAGSGHEAVGNAAPSRMLEVALAFNESRIRVRPDAVQACVDFMRARPCNAFIEPNASGRCLPGEVEAHDPCAIEQLFEGLVPPGAECLPGAHYTCAEGQCKSAGGAGTCTRSAGYDELCTTNQDCEAGLYCDPIEGRCKVGAQLGQNCAYLDPTQPLPGTEVIACAEGLECDPLDARCVATCSAGASCFDDSGCPQGLVCAVDRCRPPGQRGDPCDAATDCVSQRCDFVSAVCLDRREDGSLCTTGSDCVSGYCDANTLVCAPQAQIGEPCDGTSQHCAEGWCAWDGETQAYSCVAWAQAGEACDNNSMRCDPEPPQDPPPGPGEPPSPEPLLVCNSEVCEPFPFAVGVTCGADFECESEVCFQQMCHPGGAPGDDCDSSGLRPKCRADLVCDRPDGSLFGSCVHKLHAGQICERDDQCWGSCQVRWATRMCDPTYPASSEQAFCDGAGLLPPGGFG